MIAFEAEPKQAEGMKATGIDVPPEVLTQLGAGKRPAVQVTIGGHTFATTIGSMGGVAKIPVSAAVRTAAGVSAGDTLTVQLELEMTPRTVTVPEDLAAALSNDSPARAFFDGLSYSRQHAYVSWIEQAKKPETRQERVERTAELLSQQRPSR
jgi:Bacteriocin-protection, YdeI or OmpD-Associated/Domain of unknown function (DUF1905)